MRYILATEHHDDIVIDHYLAVWESYGTPPGQFRGDAREVARTFLREGRRERRLASFIALDGDIPTGSVSCQLHFLPYPAALKDEHMLHGYVWSVYTDPAYRGQGIAEQLMKLALKHLEEVGCTTAVLHSSAPGEGLYRRLGFDMAKEMRMKLKA